MKKAFNGPISSQNMFLNGAETSNTIYNPIRNMSDQQSELLTDAERRDVEAIEEQFNYQLEMELKGYYL